MTNNGEYSYSQAVARLEEIMQAIQSGSVEIDTLYRLLKEADELIKFCRTRLYEVDEEVKMLLDSMNEESAM
ncbi:MAG: exodeoxyribonuclease VII small subunit [Bacteroidaceae bacterium]|nr:exodeoxyribonuclease VII small subunit [Bacteroidaceae bacterium]MBQ3152145.1 exodeoxyribonuclease VII small subunit [Bacteroidaceae bacterium]MBQ4039014.1 exodeoxyribonuclease VII small subunit [Bacteroidaceae bacterium]MBR5150062.1 exodeoxyribonuclease VII small subunit [Bacteroidaceae bacterium]MBR5277227.1 exodeoxyribonuclease VII small subunit [Bacteroidaceae bacterium]